MNELAEPFDMSLQAVSQHLKVLERAGLISRGRDAQFRPCRFQAEPLDRRRVDRPQPADLDGAVRPARAAPQRPYNTRADRPRADIRAQDQQAQPEAPTENGAPP